MHGDQWGSFLAIKAVATGKLKVFLCRSTRLCLSAWQNGDLLFLARCRNLCSDKFEPVKSKDQPKKDVDLPCRPCRKHDAVGQCRIPHWATCPKWSPSSKVWNRSFSKRLRDLMQAVAPLMDNLGKKSFCVSRYPNTFLEIQIHFFDSRGG
jgi:hypothetical protein